MALEEQLPRYMGKNSLNFELKIIKLREGNAIKSMGQIQNTVFFGDIFQKVLPKASGRSKLITWDGGGGRGRTISPMVRTGLS